jgi:hypothetical protein
MSAKEQTFTALGPRAACAGCAHRGVLRSRYHGACIKFYVETFKFEREVRWSQSAPSGADNSHFMILSYLAKGQPTVGHAYQVW